MKGVVFDIQEFAVNDGPGLRVTVFMKGCPLRCKWCHNPEGIGFGPQLNVTTKRLVGTEWESSKLVEHLLRFKSAFDISGGGVTFSGGEPTAQFEFVYGVARSLREKGVRINLDTSGYCDEGRFKAMLEVVDLVYFDVKCLDDALHQEMTGVSNAIILRNLKQLAVSPVSYRIRIPTTKGVSDTPANRRRVDELVAGLPCKPEDVDWLPFNFLASAKYENFDMEYTFDE